MATRTLERDLMRVLEGSSGRMSGELCGPGPLEDGQEVGEEATALGKMVA